MAREAGAALPAGPYPDDWAAMHHMLDEGWMYILRFDDGLVSAGLLRHTRRRAPLLARGRGATLPGAGGPCWPATPRSAAQFQDARPVFPVRFARTRPAPPGAGGGRRAGRCSPTPSPSWIPLFSTGIAWSLLAVERLAEAFGNARAQSRGLPSRAALRRYEALLAAEADQIDRLVAAAYLALPDFELFTAHAMLYFAVVSFAETRQRLIAGSGWEPFLGAGEPDVERSYRESLRRLARLTGRGRHPASPEARREFAAWVAREVASRNVAGLADPERRNLYPVDFEVLVERSHLLGLTPSDVRRALPRLRA